MRGSGQHTVIPSNKRIAIAVEDPAVNVFLRLLQCDIHISIKARQHACVEGWEISACVMEEATMRHASIIYTRGQAYDYAFADNAFQEVCR